MGWCSVPFNSRTLVSLPKALVTGTLPNGLRYMLLPNAQPSGRAEIRLVLNVGSAAEALGQEGHAHFLELWLLEERTPIPTAQWWTFGSKME